MSAILKVRDANGNVVEVPAIVGPQGEQGVQGEQGPIGPQGEVGPAGPQGEQGIQGEQGLQGIQGDAGGYYTPNLDTEGNLTFVASDENMPAVAGGNIRGPQGLQGEQGVQGERGEQGIQGLQGEQGPAGQSAYAAAQAGGYSGTENAFYTDLAAMDGLAAWFANY